MKENEKSYLRIADKYFQGNISGAELKKFIMGLEDEKLLEAVGNAMEKHWESGNEESLSDDAYQELLDKIHHRIAVLDRRSGTQQRRVAAKESSSGLFRVLMKVAAVLFLPLLVATSYLVCKNNATVPQQPVKITYSEIYTPMSAKTRFILPDSSVVWLNSGSTLRYPTVFTGKSREVFLDGEGYFNVTHNPRVPFIVHTKKIDVTAFGTSFDVMAYPGDLDIMTTLVSGKVRVKKRNTGASVDLTPSCQVVFDTITGKMKVNKVETRFYTSWKDGKLIFKNERMDIVANKLERWFNCRIYITNDKIKKYRYTGNIEMETLREVLELIRITTPIAYTYNRSTREIWIRSS